MIMDRKEKITVLRSGLRILVADVSGFVRSVVYGRALAIGGVRPSHGPEIHGRTCHRL